MHKKLWQKTKVQMAAATIVLTALTMFLPQEWQEVGYLIVLLGLTCIGTHFATDVADRWANRKPKIVTTIEKAGTVVSGAEVRSGTNGTGIAVNEKPE